MSDLSYPGSNPNRVEAASKLWADPEYRRRVNAGKASARGVNIVYVPCTRPGCGRHTFAAVDKAATAHCKHCEKVKGSRIPKSKLEASRREAVSDQAGMRDVSWVIEPGIATAYHMVRGELSACGLLVIAIHTKMPAVDVPIGMRCKRCKRHWPVTAP